MVESGTCRLPAGKRPALLSLNDKRTVIGVEIQGTRMVVGAADLTGKFLAQEVATISLDPETIVEQIVRHILKYLHLCRGRTIDGVGISLTESCNPQLNTRVCPSGPAWTAATHIQGRVAQATGLDVELDNAANACIIASVLFDGLDGCRNVAAVRVTEEIEVGMLANGQLIRGLDGLAGDFGHVSLDPNGPTCECRGRGCWAELASNCAALRRYFGQGPLPSEFTFADLLSLAERGEACASAVIENMAHYLGRGMRIIAAAFAPECILVIGDLAACWHRFGPVIESEISAQLRVGARRPKLLPRHDPGLTLRGAAALALQKQFPRAAGGI